MKINRVITTLTLTAFLGFGLLALSQDRTNYGDQGRGSVTVPAGTEIAVRTNEAIDSQNAELISFFHRG